MRLVPLKLTQWKHENWQFPIHKEKLDLVSLTIVRYQVQFSKPKGNISFQQLDPANIRKGNHCQKNKKKENKKKKTIRHSQKTEIDW